MTTYRVSRNALDLIMTKNTIRPQYYLPANFDVFIKKKRKKL